MTRLMVVIACLAMLVGLWPAASAVAGPVTYDLNVISSSTIGSGTLATVTLIQVGSNELDLAVALAPGTAFVSTGGHNAFAFNLDLTTPYVVTITNPRGGSFTPVATSRSHSPYGTFTYAINCPGCGPGSSHANPGPLAFKVTDASGIAVSDFIANDNGFFFSADVLGPGGHTGNIAADAATPTLASATEASAVPEPASLPLLAGSVVALGVLVRRRVR